MLSFTVLLSDVEKIYERKVYSILDLASDLGGLFVAFGNILGPFMKYYTH